MRQASVFSLVEVSMKEEKDFHEEAKNGDETFEQEEDGPYLDLLCTGPRIKTLEQLLEIAKVDLDLYEVEYYRVNAWEQSQKNRIPDDPRPVMVTLYQVKATLRRKVLPLPRYPIKPISIALGGKEIKVRRRYSGKIKRYLLWSDPHFSFFTKMDGTLEPVHDVRCLGALEVLMKEEKFYGSLCTGDLLDLSEFSDKFITMPAYQRQTQHALAVAAQWLLRLNTHVLIEGNHDERMQRLMLKYNQAAYGLRTVDELDNHPALSIPTLLNLKKHGIEWVGNYPHGETVIGDVHLFHGDVARKSEEATVRAYLADCDYSVVFGHIHRSEKAERYQNGKMQTSMALGCCCRLDGVVPGHKPRHQHWNQSGGVLTVYPDGTTQLEIVPVVDGVAYWRGKEYSGE